MAISLKHKIQLKHLVALHMLLASRKDRHDKVGQRERKTGSTNITKITSKDQKRTILANKLMRYANY